MQTAEGAKIEIEDVSALAFNSKNKYEKVWSKTEKINFRKEINRLTSRGVIKPISDSENGFVSSIFLREKKENKHRLILNLKEFNENVVYRHFKMDNLKTALNMMRHNCFMVSIDLSDAYYSVPVALTDQKYLLFKFEGQLYKFVCLPNGLSSAPRIFTKLLKPVFSALHKQGHQIMGYLDDSFLMGDTFEECKKSVIATVKLFTKLGFQVHPDKSNLFPSQEIHFLGFILNSKNMTVTLTDEKQTKIVEYIKVLENKKDLKIRDLAKLLGMCEAALPAVQFGRLHMWNLLKIKNNALKMSKGDYKNKCRLNDASHIELKWWIKNVSYKNRINTPPPSITCQFIQTLVQQVRVEPVAIYQQRKIGPLKNHKNT